MFRQIHDLKEWPNRHSFYSNKKIIQMLYSTNQLCYNDYSILNEDSNYYYLSWSLRQNLTRNSTNLTESSDVAIANAFRFTKSNLLQKKNCPEKKIALKKFKKSFK